MRAKRVAAVLTGLSLAVQASGACLPLDPGVVSIVGRLESRVYPGAPNYRSVADGDAPESVLMLVLVQPVCVAGDEQKAVHEIQIASYARDSFTLYMSAPVVVSGILFRSVAGHQHADILLHALSVQSDI